MATRIRFKILDKIQETLNTTTLVLEPQRPIGNYLPGQFLTFIFNPDEPSEFRRSYSLSSTPGLDHLPTITVKKQANGQASGYLTEKVGVGDYLLALPPAGQFTLEAQPDASRDLFFFGAGSGITPLFSLIKYFLKYEPLSRLTLIDANRDEKAIIFNTQLHRLARDYADRFTCIHLLSDPKEDPAAIPAPALRQWGRLSNFRAEEFIKTYRRNSGTEAHFFLCGPANFMLKTEMVLGYLGYPKSQIHQEIFTIKERAKPKPDNLVQSEVELTFLDERLKFFVNPGQTILEAALAAGYDLPYSCRTGSCTACAGHCESGKAILYTPDTTLDTDQTRGLILTCVGYPLTADLRMRIPG